VALCLQGQQRCPRADHQTPAARLCKPPRLPPPPPLTSSSRAPRSGSNSKGGARKKAVKEPLTPPSPTSEDRKRSAISDAPPIKKEPLVRPPAPIGRNSFSSTPAGLDPASLLGLSAPPGSDGTGSNGLQQYFPIRPTRRRKTTGLGDDDNLMEESEEDDTHDLEELIRIKERSLVGSLTNSYAFKEGGLVKRVRSRPSLAGQLCRVPDRPPIHYPTDHVDAHRRQDAASRLLLYAGRRHDGSASHAVDDA